MLVLDEGHCPFELVFGGSKFVREGTDCNNINVVHGISDQLYVRNKSVWVC